MAHDVFVSHSSKDKPVADAVCARLEAAKIRCWIAPRDILPGADWGEAIVSAIEQSKLMVLVFSEHANESKQITREVERAVNKGVAILPVRIEDVKPTKALEYFISTPHWLDAITPPLDAHLEYLCQTAKVLIDRTENREAQPQAPRVVKKPPFWKQRYVQIAAGILSVLALVFALKPASVIEKSFLGDWETGTKGGGLYWTQTNESDGSYENTVVLVESGSILVTHGTMVQLIPSTEGPRYISWKPTDPTSAKSAGIIPNIFWGYVSYSSYQNGQGMAEINQVATNNIWTRATAGPLLPSPLGNEPQHWESHPTLGGQEWLMTLDTKLDRSYVFKATFTDKGTLHAKNGKWTGISGTQIMHSGDYQIIDKDRISLTGPFVGAVVWKRIKS